MRAIINANKKAALHIPQKNAEDMHHRRAKETPADEEAKWIKLAKLAHTTPLVQHPAHTTPSKHQLQETGISATEYENEMMANFKEGRIYAAYNRNFARLDVVGVYTIWSGHHDAKTTCKGTSDATNTQYKS